MSPEQKQVHERLMTMLPVRTHGEKAIAEPRKKGGGRLRTAVQASAMRERVRTLKNKRKWSVSQISEHLKVSTQTVYNYLRKHR